jgi:predicted kinase
MVLQIKILVGIPGSGKSTWAKQYILDNPNTKRINRDDLRNMLDSGKTTQGNENFIRTLRLELINMCIIYDKNIIIDDTNCYHEQLKEMIDFIQTNKVLLKKDIEIEIIDFDADVDVCVERNDNREEKIPKEGIYHMKSSKDEINFDSLLIDKYTKLSAWKIKK